MQSVETPTLAHSFVTFPGDSQLVLGVEKWNRSLSVVDFHRERVIGSIEPGEHRNFYGHVCWDRDGKHFISPQMDVATRQGYLVWYEGSTLRQVDELAIARGGSHDLGFLPGTDTLVITSSGLAPDYGQPAAGPKERVGASVVAFYDVRQRRLLREWEMADHGEFPGHLKIGTDGQVYMASSIFANSQGENKRSAGAIYDVSFEQPLREWDIPASVRQSLSGELLSLEIDEDLDRLVVTNPGSRQLLTFGLRERKWIDSVPTISTGIAWNRPRRTLYGFELGEKVARRESRSGYLFARLPSMAMSAHILYVHA